MKTFAEKFTTDYWLEQFEMNGEDNYTAIDVNTNVVYAIGHELNGLILDFNWNNRNHDVNLNNIKIATISDNDYNLIYQRKMLRVNDYKLF